VPTTDGSAGIDANSRGVSRFGGQASPTAGQRRRAEPTRSGIAPAAAQGRELAALVVHLRRLSSQVAGLELDEGSITVDGEPTDVDRGVVLRYRPSCGRGEVKLWVSGRRVRLRTWWTVAGLKSELNDWISVRLGPEPVLARVRYGSGAQLAGALVDLMRRRVEGLPLGPRLPPASTQAGGSVLANRVGAAARPPINRVPPPSRIPQNGM
jgi:hypothetical protein